MKNLNEFLYNEKLIFRPEILLQPPLIKPLHGLNPRTLMGQGWWDLKRQQCYAKLDYHCFACGIEKIKAQFRQWLEAHECYQIDFEKYEVKFVEIVALCYCCHNFIHIQRLQELYKKGEINKFIYDTIIKHGNKVLKKAKLIKPIYDEEKWFPEENGTWSEWYLLFEGKKYKSLWKSYDDWEKNYIIA